MLFKNKHKTGVPLRKDKTSSIAGQHLIDFGRKSRVNFIFCPGTVSSLEILRSQHCQYKKSEPACLEVSDGGCTGSQGKLKLWSLLIEPRTFPGSSDSKESTCNAEDLGLISGLGRSLGRENGNPLQHSCLENPMDRGDWWATVAKSLTRLSN